MHYTCSLPCTCVQLTVLLCGCAPGRRHCHASWQVTVQFKEFKLLGLIPVKAPPTATGELQVTYLDEELRVSRGNKGNLFVLRMQASAGGGAGWGGRDAAMQQVALASLCCALLGCVLFAYTGVVAVYMCEG